MALEVSTVDRVPFEWTWQDDPDVKMMLRPATSRIEKAAAKSSGLEISIEDGSVTSKVYQQAEHLIILGYALIESWEGIIEPNGGPPLALTRENVEWVWEKSSKLINDAIAAARAKMEEIENLAGKSKTQPSGTAGGSTAEPANSPVTFSLPGAG
jgi:hypothetical protein